MYDEPRSPNEGACVRYRMNRNREMRGAGRVLRCMMNRYNQMRGRVYDVMNRQPRWHLQNGGGAAPLQPPGFLKPCKHALVNVGTVKKASWPFVMPSQASQAHKSHEAFQSPS